MLINGITSSEISAVLTLEVFSTPVFVIKVLLLTEKQNAYSYDRRMGETASGLHEGSRCFEHVSYMNKLSNTKKVRYAV